MDINLEFEAAVLRMELEWLGSCTARRRGHMIKFEQTGRREDGETLYRLILDGKPVREGMTLDEVVREINRRDFADLGERHTPHGRA